MVDDYPDAFKAFFGLGDNVDYTSAIGYLNGELFSFMVPLLLLIAAIGAGARATAGEEERGTLELLLANPISRRRLVLDKLAALAAELCGLVLVLWPSSSGGGTAARRSARRFNGSRCFARGPRPGPARRALRRRPGGNHHVFDPRRRLWLPAALGPRPLDRRADRLPRARRAHRGRHRPGTRRAVRERSVPAGPGRARRAGRRQFRHPLRRVRRAWPPPSTCGASAATSPSRSPRSRRRALVLRGGFHRVEHVLLALSSIFVAYILAGFLAHPGLGRAARGLVVRAAARPATACSLIVAAVGTTLAPWGLAFIQSYAVDKRLAVERPELRADRRRTGAVLTGVIGALHRRRLRGDAACARGDIDDAARCRAARSSRSPARSRRPVRGRACSAPHCWPRRSCRSRPPTRSAEACGQTADLDDRSREARVFYATYGRR